MRRGSEMGAVQEGQPRVNSHHGASRPPETKPPTACVGERGSSQSRTLPSCSASMYFSVASRQKVPWMTPPC